MIHIGIDHHKKFSHVVAIDDSGKVCWDGRLASDKDAFESLKNSLPAGEPVQCVLEAGRNWGILYDALEELEMHPHLANPLKMRLIAETCTKTDKIDASIHAVILKAGMTPLVHVPPRDVRAQKNLLRQRFWLVKIRTLMKNRVHNIVDRNHHKPPERTDLFGTLGRAWMNALELPDPDGQLLKSDLKLIDAVQVEMRQTEKWIDQTLKENANLPILMTLPGVGKLLGALIALELDTVTRFRSPAKLCSYAGLVCSTYSSADKTTHGGLVSNCNRHLRYAFIEAAWTAIRVSPYFGAYHQRLKYRLGGKKAIGAAARRLCEIAWHCTTNRRDYREKPYQFRSGRLGGCLA